MGWFDEQIRQRKIRDEAALSEALMDIIGAVEDKKVFYIPEDSRKAIKNEIDKILRYYHVKSRELPDSVKKTEDQLEYLFRPHGIMRRTVILKGNWYQNAVGPLLARRVSDESIVALLPGKRSGYWFTDAALGKPVKVTADNAGNFAADALCFYKPFPLKALTQSELFKYILKTIPARYLAQFALITLFVLLISTLIPALYHLLFGAVYVQDDLQPLIAISIFLISVSISVSVLTGVKGLYIGRIQHKMKVEVEAAVMMRILSLPASFFKQHSSGSLASKVMSVSELCQIIAESAMATSLTALFSLVFMVQIYLYTPSLMIWAVLSLFALILVSAFTAAAQIKLKRKQIDINAETQGLVYALLSGIHKIKLFGAEKRAFSKWGKKFSEQISLVYDPPFLLRIRGALSKAVMVFSTVVIYFAAVQSRVSVADFYTFNSAFGIVSGAFGLFADALFTIACIKPLLENIQLFFKAIPEVSDEKQVVSRLSGGIELNSISFRYDKDMPNVIDNLSLKIHSGQYVAIVGTTGCGKSTLLRLMLGFEKPQRGAIYYDGKDLSKLDLKSLRSKIGVVMQDGKLFQGDIFSNIAVTAPNLTLEQAWQAAEMAGIAEDIRNMPMGMHTIISEGSGGISGGQRQRILIARAIAAKPKILMFDEATSALDNITQRTVSQSLDRLKCTRIVIAHRLSTIEKCNRIIVLDQGRIVEDGTYDDLVKKNGLFSELVSRQKLD